MENRDLILKAVEYVNDIPARVDEFLKMQKEEIKEPEFKVGQWVKTNRDNSIFRITHITDNGMYSGISYKMESDDYVNWSNDSLRLATKEEIESHLIEVAKKKGFVIGAKFKSCFDDNDLIRKIMPYDRGGKITWGYSNKGDTLRSEDGINNSDGGCSNPLIYKEGEWADIIPDKKKLPKTKEEFRDLLCKFQDDALLPFPTMDVDDFLNQYAE